MLTAGHLIDAEDEADRIIQVRPLGERDWLVEGVSVVWCRRDSTIDAALLRVESAPWRLLPDGGALRWARPAPDQRVSCTTIGFPESQTRPGGVRDTDEAVGRLSPNTRAKGGRLTVDVESPTPSGSATSPWSGMSGAALLSLYGRRLLGVVVADMHAFGHRRLEAVGVEALLSDEVFAALVGHPVLDLVDARERPALDRRVFREPYEALPARYAEAELLVPHHGIVPFLGRAAELSDLQKWCRSAPAFSVALLTGERGAGKSRLAAELCVQMRGDDGWDAFFADRDPVADDAWAAFDPDWPLVVVFDYPEQMTLALTTLIDRLNARRRIGPRVRLLLATRQAGGWWQDVNSETNGLLDAATDLRMTLASAGFGPKERAAHASVAVTAFADHLDQPSCSPPDVSGEAYGSLLPASPSSPRPCSPSSTRHSRGRWVCCCATCGCSGWSPSCSPS